MVTTTMFSREEMDDDTFHAMMARGLEEAKAGQSIPAKDVFASLKAEIAQSQK